MGVVHGQDTGRAGQQHAGEAASTSEPSGGGGKRGARDTGVSLAAAPPEVLEERWSEYQAGKKRSLEKIGTEKLKRRWFGARPRSLGRACAWETLPAGRRPRGLLSESVGELHACRCH